MEEAIGDKQRNMEINAQHDRGLGREKDNGDAEINHGIDSPSTKDTDDNKRNFGVALRFVLLQMLDEELYVFRHDITTLENHICRVFGILGSDPVEIGRETIIYTNQANVGLYQGLLGEPSPT